jgi:cell division protein FtsQ
VLARFAELRAWFAPLKLVPEALNLSSRYAWTVKLDNGMSVALGREQDHATLKTRVERLVSVYNQLTGLIPNGAIDTIDMRYPNGMALTAAGLAVPADATKPVKPVVKKNTPNSPLTSKTTKHTT